MSHTSANLFLAFLASIFLLNIHSKINAVEFSECEKLNKTPYKYSDCLNYSFSEAITNSDFEKISSWLKKNPNTNKYNDYLTILMCGINGNNVSGRLPFKSKDRKKIIKLTNHLLNLGASFDAMPSFSIVTPLFCVSNRRDSEILDYVLTRIKATKKDLDSCPYEGIDPAHVPLYRAVLNNDLKSAKILVKHGASPDFSIMENETALKAALDNKNIKIANWLLDIGASVNKKDENNGCSGKSALDYALEIPKNTKGRKEVISRIKMLMLLPSNFKEKCKK